MPTNKRQPTREIDDDKPILAKHLNAVMAGEKTIDESEVTAFNLEKLIKSDLIPRKFILVPPEESTEDWGDLEWKEFEEGKSDNQIQLSMSRDDSIIFDGLEEKTGLTRSCVGRRTLAVGAIHMAGRLRDFHGYKEMIKLVHIPNDFLRSLTYIHPGFTFDTDSSRMKKREHIRITSKLSTYIAKNVIKKIYGMSKSSCYRLCWKAGIQFYYADDVDFRKAPAQIVDECVMKMIEWEENIEMIKTGFRDVIERWELEKGDDKEYQSIGLSATPDHNRNKKWVRGQKN